MLVGVSFKGIKHEEEKKPCQDAYRMEMISGDSFVAAVADGCSGAQFSEIGAQANVQSACDFFHKLESPQTPFLVESNEFACELVKFCKRNLLRLYNTIDISELSSTLLVVYVYKKKMITIHVGDGMIAAKMVDGTFSELSSPSNINSSTTHTHFVSDKDVLEHIKVRVWDFSSISNVIMMTDGPQIAFSLRGAKEEGFKTTYFNILDMLGQCSEKRITLEVMLKGSFNIGEFIDDWTVVMFDQKVMKYASDDVCDSTCELDTIDLDTEQLEREVPDEKEASVFSDDLVLLDMDMFSVESDKSLSFVSNSRKRKNINKPVWPWKIPCLIWDVMNDLHHNE